MIFRVKVSKHENGLNQYSAVLFVLICPVVWCAMLMSFSVYQSFYAIFFMGVCLFVYLSIRVFGCGFVSVRVCNVCTNANGDLCCAVLCCAIMSCAVLYYVRAYVRICLCACICARVCVRSFLFLFELPRKIRR